MTFTQPQRIWQILILAVLLLTALPAQAAIQEIRVLATGVNRSSSKAAEIALEYAKLRAVYLMARKMQVPDASQKVAKLTEEQLREIIRGASVLQTRREGEITYADVTVSVLEEPLRRAMGLEPVEASKVNALTTARGILLLPVYVGKDRPYLWEKENPMHAPVRTQVMRQARGSVLMPAGDFDDRRLVGYDNALEVTSEELSPMFARYGVDEIVVAVVTLSKPGTLDPSSILLRRLPLPPNVSRVEEVLLKPENPAMTLEERAEDAAVAMAGAVTQIAGATSQLQRDALAEAQQIRVMFRYATARDLAEMQSAVRDAPGVMQLSMPAITLQGMEGVMYLSGPAAEVKKAIMAKGFMVRDRGEGWLVSVR